MFRFRLSIRGRRRRDERGYVLAVSAIIMVPLLAISGMATDIGGWYAEGSKMQKAADAAALAGVVWLPDLPKATQVAIDTARQNGFDNDLSNISVVVGQLSNTELRVSITDNNAPIFFSKFFMSSMTIKRESIGTYVLPVPLGSPTNYFGTGGLAPSPDGMWAAINGWCAPKEQGDPFAVGWMGNWPSGGQVCPGSTANPQYVPNPTDVYQYVIKVPPLRVLPIVVQLYSPAKTNSAPDSNDGTTITTTFNLKSPDGTPFDDSDNPYTSCSGSGQTNPRTYAPGEVDNDFTIFGQTGWSSFCTIPASAPAGDYILGVRTLQGEAGSNGSNSYAVMASYSGLGVTCDFRTDSVCPTVVGKNWMSVLAASSSPAADFYLAEIGAEHAGKQMEITLFDPGEGGNYIQIKDPNGNPVNFDYHTVDGDYSGTGLNKLDVSGCTGYPQVGSNRSSQCRYNERFVVIDVDLPSNYATLYPGQKWWKIYYNFSSAVTDRSTWSVKIIGDPVHLSR
ncbi:MAG: pilus assembly protein TadG-related protein [Acidimicrobiales bacterium]